MITIKQAINKVEIPFTIANESVETEALPELLESAGVFFSSVFLSPPSFAGGLPPAPGSAFFSSQATLSLQSASSSAVLTYVFKHPSSLGSHVTKSLLSASSNTLLST